MKNVIIFACAALCFVSCNQMKKGETAAAAVPGVAKEIVASNLYQYYTANPTSQLEKDNNAIIEYAVEKNLNCDRTPGGVFYATKKKGTGETFKPGDKVSANYAGYLLNGSKFDSSYDRNQPLNFSVGQMIKGWNEWLTFANPGTSATLLIPSHLAYGARARGEKIPANSPLVFDVEVLVVE